MGNLAEKTPVVGDRLTAWQIFVTVCLSMPLGTNLSMFKGDGPLVDANFLGLVAAGAVGFVFVLLMVWLVERAGGGSVRDFAQGLATRPVGKAFLAVFTVYFMIRAAGYTKNYSDMVKLSVLERTPQLLIVAIVLFAALYLMRFGVNQIARTCEIAVFFTVAPLFLMMALALAYFNYRELLPFFRVSLADVAAEIPTSVPNLQGYEVILFILCYARDKKRAGRFAVAGYLFSFLVYVLIFVVLTGVFTIAGLNATTFPISELSKVINLHPFLVGQSFDFIFVAIRTITVTIEAAVCIYLASVSLCGIFGLQNYRAFGAALVPAIFVVCAMCHEFVFGEILTDILGYSFYAILGMVPVLLILTAIRRKGADENG